MRKTLFALTATLLLSGTTALAAPQGPFANMISPVSNPTNFEDPRIDSEIRPIFVYHDIDNDFLNTVENVGLKAPGGDAKVLALQLRVKLMDRLSLIATKDGYVWVDPNDDVLNVVSKDSGFANLAAGLKYNFLNNEDLGLLGSGGIRYEGPTGEPSGLQGAVFKRTAVDPLAKLLGADPALVRDMLHEHGAGLINLFLSGAWACGDFHLMGYTGPRLALQDIDSSFYDTSLHADYKIGPFFPTLEINWVHVLEGGNRLQPLADASKALLSKELNFDEEGFDFFNLGAPNAGGTDVATIGFGGRWRILDDLDLFGSNGGLDFGTVAEFPMTSRHDVFAWRVTTDFILWAN